MRREREGESQCSPAKVVEEREQCVLASASDAVAPAETREERTSFASSLVAAVVELSYLTCGDHPFGSDGRVHTRVERNVIKREMCMNVPSHCSLQAQTSTTKRKQESIEGREPMECSGSSDEGNAPALLEPSIGCKE